MSAAGGQKQLQGSERPVAQPTYILRGHGSAVHTLAFFRSNLRLLSGDADGWVVVWAIATKRATAVWKAHDTTVLGAELWGEDKIITHGRDGRLRVWIFTATDEESLSKELPVEENAAPRREPWLFHSLEISSPTFCSFASCDDPSSAQVTAVEASPTSDAAGETEVSEKGGEGSNGTDQILVAVPGSTESAIEIYRLPSEKQVALIPAPEREDGKTGMVMALRLFHRADKSLIIIAGYESGRVYVFEQILAAGKWQVLYTSRPHSQPILSLDVTPSLEFFFTSSADAVIAKHSLPTQSTETGSMKEVQTRHAGQQGLHTRSDGKIFATAGWDARVRVYSVKTMKELAVLKWHKEGCYALSFAEILQDGAADSTSDRDEKDQYQSGQVVRQNRTISRPMPVAQSRDARARLTHWLAVGSKDGKVSLWDIY